MNRHTTTRAKGPMAGPWRKVVYIFEREGERSGSIWWLVLECGHAVARPRSEVKSWSTMVRAMFEPIEKRLAPKRCQCHYCEFGTPKADPWILVEAFGGPKR
jgi:hypothetical protein